MKYIDAEKLLYEIERRIGIKENLSKRPEMSDMKESLKDIIYAYQSLKSFIISLQQEPLANMIQWAGNNLKEVIDFTGKSPRFGEWFKSWEEYENYVHSHNDILKLFCEDGSHYEVPVGAWIVKTPDGHNVPSVARFIHAKQEQPEVDLKEYLSAKLFSLGADLIRHKPYSFNRGLNVGMTKAYDDILKKINARKE